MRISWKIVTGVTVGMLLGAGVSIGIFRVFTTHNVLTTSSDYLCTRCRAHKYAKTIGGMNADRIEETEYTRWYHQTQPAHQHHWGDRGVHYSGMLVACGKAEAIWNIPDDIQKSFVMSATPTRLKRFYTLIESHDYYNQNRALLMAYAVDNLPDCTNPGNSYKVAPYIHAAIVLQKEGEIGGWQKLLALARDRELNSSIFVLCRMLYVPKDKQEWRRPMLGGAGFLGNSDYADWPLEPITLSDGVPFLITIGYSVEGRPEAAEEYLRYCNSNGNWNPVPFQPKTDQEKQQALQKLLTSPHWKTSLEPHEIAFLSDQIK